MSVEPHMQEETPPDYDEVVAEGQGGNRSKKKTDNVNVAYEPDIDRIEVAIEPEEGYREGHVTGNTAATSSSTAVPSAEKVPVNRVAESLSAQEEKMLSVLRDVAQKCTNANPLKRPSADQVLKMLQAINPYPDDYDEEADDDDEDEGDDMDVKYKVSDEYDTKSTNKAALAALS